MDPTRGEGFLTRSDAQSLTEYELYQLYRKSSKRSSSNEIETLKKENLSLKAALLEAEKGWQEAILFAREMQFHLREREERLQESSFQKEALKDQLTRQPKVRSLSSESEISFNSHPSVGGGMSEACTAAERQTTAAKITLLEAELQLYHRQIQKQQQSQRGFHQQLRSLMIDLSLSHSTLLTSFQTLLSSEPFRSNSSLRKEFQDISRRSIRCEPEGSVCSSDSEDPNGSSEEMILSCLADHIEKTKLFSSWCEPLQAHLMQMTSPFHSSPLAPAPNQIPPPTLQNNFQLSANTVSSYPSFSVSSSTSQRESGEGNQEKINHNPLPSIEERIGREMEQLREQMREMSQRLSTRDVSGILTPSRFSSPPSRQKTPSSEKPFPLSKSGSPPKSRTSSPPVHGSPKSPSPLKRPLSRSQSPPKRSISPKTKTALSLESLPRSSSPSAVPRGTGSVASTSRLFAPGVHGMANRMRAIGSIRESGKLGVPHTLLMLTD